MPPRSAWTGIRSTPPETLIEPHRGAPPDEHPRPNWPRPRSGTTPPVAAIGAGGATTVVGRGTSARRVSVGRLPISLTFRVLKMAVIRFSAPTRGAGGGGLGRAGEDRRA